MKLCFKDRFLPILLILGCASGNLLADQAQESVSKQRMKPTFKNGRYYYDSAIDLDYEHINLSKALGFLANKVVLSAPKKCYLWACSLFSKKAKQDVELQKLLQESLQEHLKPQQIVPSSQSQELVITWVGHATFLVQVDGFNILTDPVFGEVKAGPLTLSKRAMPAGIKFEDLPPIDAIVISHNHSDHTDTNSLTALAKAFDPIVYVPEGNKELIASMGFSRVIECTWWDKKVMHKEGKTLTMTCLPALHWSIRFSLQSYRKALWSGWMISAADRHVYFAGDTAYGDHFKQIGDEFPSIDAALLPIGPTNEHDNKQKNCNAHAKYCHIDAVEAVDACIDLNARCFIPMHYGTFFLSKHNLILPVRRLKEYWQEKADLVAGSRLLIAGCGHTCTFEDNPSLLEAEQPAASEQTEQEILS